MFTPVASQSIKDFRDSIYREWVEGSGIHPDLFLANVEVVLDELVTVGGETSRPIHEALNWTVSRWQLCGKQRNYGAIIKAVDFGTSEVKPFQVKLSNPIFDTKKGKSRKYENPLGQGQIGGYACVSREVWQKVADRYNLPTPENLNDRYWYGKEFWDWVIAFNLPVLITEGMKKACSLLSLGFVAIALSGITMGRKNLTGKLELQDYLKIFATEGRLVYFCFDAETKPKTIFNVYLAQSRTGKLFADAGCEVKIVELPLLPNTDKTGVDDLIVAKGELAIAECISNARNLFGYRWHFKHSRRLSIKPSVTVFTNSLLKSIGTLPIAGIIAIASGKATEKTKLIARETANDSKVLALTHLISLGRNLSRRMNLSCRNDLDHAKGFGYLGNVNRFALCIPSLLAINPREYIGCTLILDEVCQLLRFLLTSNLNTIKHRRAALLARLEELIKVAGRIIIADADLTDAEINYIQRLRGDNQPVYLIHNEFKLDGFNVRFIRSSDDKAIITELIRDLQDGHKIHICCDSKDKCNAIAKLIEGLGLNLRVMVINSQTSGGSDEAEFIANINSAVLNYDVLISSPTLNTGVSIEVQHFTKVYGIYEGVLPDSDIAQSLSRYRLTVDRVVWCSNQGLNFSHVSRASSPANIKNALKVSHEVEVSLIRSSLNPDLIPFVNTGYSFDNNPHIDLFCHYEAYQNDAMYNLSDCLIERLQHEGHNVEVVEVASPKGDCSEAIKQAKAQVKDEKVKQLCTAKIVKGKELQQLETKEIKSPEELNILEASKLADFYAVDSIDEKLVKFDNEGRARFQIRELEALDNADLAVSSDISAIQEQATFKGFGTAWDIPKRELRRQVRVKSGFADLVERLKAGDCITEADLEPWRNYVKFHNKALEQSGFAATQNKSASWLFQQWCKQLGLNLISKRDRSTNLETHYSLDFEHWNFIQEILTRRASRRGESQGRSQLDISISPIAETKAENALEGDHNSLLFIYKKESCDHLKEEQEMPQFKLGDLVRRLDLSSPTKYVIKAIQGTKALIKDVAEMYHATWRSLDTLQPEVS